MEVIISVGLFIVAGICEIGGGYMIWLWLREDKPFIYGVLGSIIIIFYGVIATFQSTNFGRAFATYGCFFIVLSLVWSWNIDNVIPDRYDIIGVIIVLIGSLIIMYAPRTIV